MALTCQRGKAKPRCVDARRVSCLTFITSVIVGGLERRRECLIVGRRQRMATKDREHAARVGSARLAASADRTAGIDGHVSVGVGGGGVGGSRERVGRAVVLPTARVAPGSARGDGERR